MGTGGTINLTVLTATTAYVITLAAYNAYGQSPVSGSVSFTAMNHGWNYSNISTIGYTIARDLPGGFGSCASKDGRIIWIPDSFRATAILVSTNYGVNFIKSNIVTTSNTPVSVSCDDTGDTLWYTINAVPYKYVLSTNTTTSLSSLIPGASAISANSTTQQYVVAAKNGGSWYSTNYGINFTWVANSIIIGNNGVGCLTMDKTGQYVALCGDYVSNSRNSCLLVSTNYGQSFNTTSSIASGFPNASATAAWGGLKYNYDGTMLVAVMQPGYVYNSTDHGTTWNVLINLINTSKYWGSYYSTQNTVWVDTTGTKFAFASNNSKQGLVYFYTTGGSLTVADASGNTGSGICGDVSGNVFAYIGVDNKTGNGCVRYYN